MSYKYDCLRCLTQFLFMGYLREVSLYSEIWKLYEFISTQLDLVLMSDYIKYYMWIENESFSKYSYELSLRHVFELDC